MPRDRIPSRENPLARLPGNLGRLNASYFGYAVRDSSLENREDAV